jgi:thiamine-monophosphate kinase
VEGTHFPVGCPAAAVGHRSLAVNLSDLAAMGATPRWCTLALAIPAPSREWLAEFSRGFFALADRAGIALVGGDTVRGPRAVAVTVHGSVAPGGWLSRSGARPGDSVYVSGTPGDAEKGRLLLTDGPSPNGEIASLQQRFLFPEPRLALGRKLCGIATAAMDLSDGLHTDLGRLASASRVAMVLDVEALPLSSALLALAGADAQRHALMGGDDYELVFTADAEPGVIVRLAADAGVRITRLGTVVAGSGVSWQQQGRTVVLDDTSFRHF